MSSWPDGDGESRESWLEKKTIHLSHHCLGDRWDDQRQDDCDGYWKVEWEVERNHGCHHRRRRHQTVPNREKIKRDEDGRGRNFIRIEAEEAIKTIVL